MSSQGIVRLELGLDFVSEPHQLGQNVVNQRRGPQLVEHRLHLLPRVAQLQRKLHLRLVLSVAGGLDRGPGAGVILAKVLSSAALREAGPVEARRATELPVRLRHGQRVPLLAPVVHPDPLGVLLLLWFALRAAAILRIVTGIRAELLKEQSQAGLRVQLKHGQHVTCGYRSADNLDDERINEQKTETALSSGRAERRAQPALSFERRSP
ncbi:hypothetical protein EYF80_010471 [Liparis tanakae]|uniref:Uncharacterized protein n=1 Tax=Liparis tanakae TaxID=230148 RepID=A0A4Z2IN80_9TELE|nr:hypothetical protein EYF80_010471 [Liparis tanakae]